MKTKYICVAGKNQIAVNAIDYICKVYSKDYQILGLTNSNDNGIDDWQPSLKKKLNDLNIKNTSLNDLYELENLVFISLEYDRIIKPYKFKTNKLYNIHFSYLPSYRGMYTSAIPILNNESHSGVTLHQIDRGIDTGKIISQLEFTIGKDEDALDLYTKYNEYAFRLLKDNLHDLINGNYTSFNQSSKKSSYYLKNSINYTDLKVDYKQTALSIKNQIRAYAFRPYQLSKYKGVDIRFSKICNEKSTSTAGKVISENTFYYKISSIDYDVQLFKDCLDEIFENIKNFENQMVHEYIEHGYPLNDKNKKGWDLLIVATFNGNKEIFDLLIQKGVNIQTTNYRKTNLLMYALNQIQEKANSYFFNRLIELGLDRNAKDCEGLSTKDWIQKRKIEF